MSDTNHALWLKAPKDPVMTVDIAPYPSVGPDELIIRTKAVAINPADWRLQQPGMLLQKYPAILGCDAAGEVVEVGKTLSTKFQTGDRVFGLANMLLGYQYAGFQEYTVLKLPAVARVPHGASYEQAGVLPLGVYAAAACLFPKETLCLAVPPSKAGNGKTLIVWGASSSVGSCGVQLAVAAGYEVFGIASKANHGMVKGLGASQCFDHHDSDMVKDVVAQLQGRNVVGALDAISQSDTLRRLSEILSTIEGANKLLASIRPGAEVEAMHGVKIVTNIQADQQAYAQVASHLWNVFLPAALANEKFQYKPDPEVVGHGLEQVQAAVDQLSRGVSAKKLIVTL